MAGELTLFGIDFEPIWQNALEKVRKSRRKISRRTLLIDFVDDSVVIAQCRIRNRQYIELSPVDITLLPEGVIEKGCPTDSAEMAENIKQIIKQRSIVAHRAGGILPIDNFITMVLCVENEVTSQDLLGSAEINKGIHLPYPRAQADVDIIDCTIKEVAAHGYRSVMVVATQRNYTDKIVDTLKQSGLSCTFVDCGITAPLRIIETDLMTDQKEEEIFAINLCRGYSNCIVISNGGPKKVIRLAPIRDYPKGNEEGSEGNEYFPVTPEDLFSLAREIKKYAKEQARAPKKIYLYGPNSKHEGVDELLEEAVNIEVRIIRPTMHPAVAKIEIPEKTNSQLLCGVVGMALKCLKIEQEQS